ncbi:hypothetical protein DRN63_04015, partial [Nanoarchaeota archaeon]
MTALSLKEHIELAQIVLEEILKDNKVALSRSVLGEEYLELQRKINKLHGSLILTPIEKLGESEYSEFFNFYDRLRIKGYSLAVLIFEVFGLLERLDLIIAFYTPDIWAYHLRQILEVSAFLSCIIGESLRDHQDRVLEHIEQKVKEYVKQKKKIKGYIRKSFGEDYASIYDDISEYVHVKITPSKFGELVEKLRDVKSFKRYMVAKIFMIYPTDDESIFAKEEMRKFEEWIEKLIKVENMFLSKLIEL